MRLRSLMPCAVAQAVSSGTVGICSDSLPGPEGAEVAQIPTHQELAIMINASRETVTRVFQILFVRRVLVRDGNTLRLVQLQLLLRLLLA